MLPSFAVKRVRVFLLFTFSGFPLHGMNKINQEPEKEFLQDLIGAVVGLVLGCLAFCLMTSCTTTRTVTEYRDRAVHDTVTLQNIVRDSVHLHDSVFFSVKGDTVRIEKFRTLYKDRLIHDSIYMTRTDTIYKSEISDSKTENSVFSLSDFLIDLILVALFCVGFFAMAYFSIKRKT